MRTLNLDFSSLANRQDRCREAMRSCCAALLDAKYLGCRRGSNLQRMTYVVGKACGRLDEDTPKTFLCCDSCLEVLTTMLAAASSARAAASAAANVVSYGEISRHAASSLAAELGCIMFIFAAWPRRCARYVQRIRR